MTESACHFHEGPDATTLAQDLARFVARHLDEGVRLRGRALLVVSGGSTPLPFFEALAKTALDWSKVSITLADERWVLPNHADSNEGLVRMHLLKDLASRATFVPLKSADASVVQGLPTVEAAVDALSWPADVVVLGVGSDAHTASLFPGSPQLVQALDAARPERCVAISAPPLPNVPVDRLSLSKRALLDARQLVVHLTGQSKRHVLEQAMQPGPLTTMPIRLAWCQTNTPCHIFYSN